MINIDTFRKLALAFDHVVEQPHFEKTSFRVKKKIFATLDIEKRLAVGSEVIRSRSISICRV